jgi:hypothetical protein
VRYKLVPLRTLEDMMDAGEIRSAPSLAVLFKALRLLAELRT